MDESSLSSLITAITLIPVYAVVTMGLSALLNSRPEYADENDEIGNRRLTLTQQFLSVILLFAIALTAVNSLVPSLTALWGNAWLHYIIVLLPFALAVLVLGEVVPKSVGAAYAEQIAPVMRVMIIPMVFVLRPLTALIYGASQLVSRLFGSTEIANSITKEELLTVIDAGQSFEEEERKMIHSVLELDETTVTEIMVPRIDIVAVEKDTSIAEARKVFLESGHSRMPVYDENIDNILGLVYVKDLLEVWHNGDTVVDSVEEITRPAHFIPETMTADQLLHEFQRNKVHMAIVVEDYGGTGGLVTLENLLEEIVGDIQDEYDEDEPEQIVQVSENEYRVDAGMVLDDLNDMLDVELSDEDVDTLGGFIFSQLERVPEPGEIIETDEVELRVVAVEGRRIREVHITRRERKATGDEEQIHHTEVDDAETEHTTPSENIA